MADGGAPPLPDQPLPDWMSWSLITDADGNQGYTIVTLPLTYYGPPIPLGTDGVWVYGGLTSPAQAPTEEPTDVAPPQEPTDVPQPSEQPTNVPPTDAPTEAPAPTEEPTQAPAPTEEPSNSPPATGPSPEPVPTSPTLESPAPVPSTTPVPTGPSSSPIISTSSGLASSTNASPTTTSRTPSTSVSSTTAPPSSNSSTGTSDALSALPSVSGTARTYLGLAPGAFLGLVLAIVLSVLLLLCCCLAYFCYRRRKQRKEYNAIPPPSASEPSARLLAGDRDPTRVSSALPIYANHNREYRRSQIALMRARGELDDEWDSGRRSPSMRSASIRLPEDDVGVSYGIRERALAAAAVGAPYSYTPIPGGPGSAGTGAGSIGQSTVVPSPARAALIAAMGLNDDARSSPTPRKDTNSTQATNDSSALHMYAHGGRSRVDSTEGTEQFFHHQSYEGDGGPTPMASSSDLHWLQRGNSQRRRTHSSHGSQSSDGGATVPPRTRNLEDVSRSAMAYPESPVSDELEDSQLMPESEGPSFVARDAPSRQSRSTRGSGPGRRMNNINNSNNQSQNDRPQQRVAQQPAILQRVLQRVLGNRLSSQPTFSIIPATPVPQSPTSSQRHSGGAPSRLSGRDFNFGGGLLFPRPPVHTNYSSGASTSRDDMRQLGGNLPSRWSYGTRAESQAASLGHGGDESSISQMEEGTPRAAHNSSGSLDATPVMQERSSASGGIPLLGFGIRRPPPSAYPSDSRASGVSSGMSTVYFDARSHASTPLGTLASGRDRTPTRYDSPPPQPISLRNVESARSLRTNETAPIFPPGLFAPSPPPPEEEDFMDALDLPPPPPAHDIRQARSLNTIFSVGTAETYDTANPPQSIGRAFIRDEHARFPPPGLEPAPRISRSVPSDVEPSDVGGSEFGRNSQYDSFGRTRRTWNPAEDSVQEGELDDEPPMAASQWRVLSSYPGGGSSLGDSLRTGSSRRDLPHAEWRLTLGQPVMIYNPQDEQESSRHSHFGVPVTEYARSDLSGSQGSRGSSNRTNVSHSRDIHSLRASEGGNTNGSGGSKGSNQTGNSRRSVSEYGQIIRRSGGSEAEALLSAFGPGPQGGTFGSMRPPTPGSFGVGERVHQENDQLLRPFPSSADPPLSAPANFQETPGIRLIGTSSAGDHGGEQPEAPMSAPVDAPRGWPTQLVPRDVTVADGRRPSEAPSFVHHDSPLYAYSPLQSLSPSRSETGLPSSPPPRMPTISTHSHTHSQSHSTTHTHGAHTVDTTIGTMTDATTEDHTHEMPHHDLPELPEIPHIALSDLEQILGGHPSSSAPGAGAGTGTGAGGEVKVVDEEAERRRLLRGRASPQSFLDLPR